MLKLISMRASPLHLPLVGLLLLVGCGSSLSSNADGGVDASRDGAKGDAAEEGRDSSHACRGPAGTIHRPEAATCPSNANDDAGCNIKPHDQCLTDSNCSDGGLCLCETPILAGQPCPGGVPLYSGNVCLPSNCRVDSDCSPCGSCLGEYACGDVTGFYCQTPEDECAPNGGPGTTSDEGNGCTFKDGRWIDGGPPLCPG
jgi:hypothetical protein